MPAKKSSAKKGGAKKSTAKRSGAQKPAAKKGPVRKKTSRRTRIDTNSGARYVRRNEQGEFEKEVSVGRSLAADRRQKAKTKVGAGQGDRGDE